MMEIYQIGSSLGIINTHFKVALHANAVPIEKLIHTKV